MEFTLERLRRDVMLRLGEIARPQSSSLHVPSAAEVVGMKVESLLPTVGGKLIVEASPEMPGSGCEEDAAAEMRKMPCGLYAAEVSLPDDFLRLVSVNMESWRCPAVSWILPGMSTWECQWSEEEGIAGSPERPRVYLDGHKLRALGVRSVTDIVVTIRGWRIPQVDADGIFEYPAMLYASLVGGLAKAIVGE